MIYPMAGYYGQRLGARLMQREVPNSPQLMKKKAFDMLPCSLDHSRKADRVSDAAHVFGTERQLAKTTSPKAPMFVLVPGPVCEL